MSAPPVSVHHVPAAAPPLPADEGPPRLVVTSASAEGLAMLVLVGRLDADSVVAVTSLADQLWAEQPAEAVIDLSGLSAIDHSGATALDEIRRAGRARGVTVRLAGGGETSGVRDAGRGRR